MGLVRQYLYHNYCNHWAIPLCRGVISPHQIWHRVLKLLLCKLHRKATEETNL